MVCRMKKKIIIWINLICCVCLLAAQFTVFAVQAEEAGDVRDEPSKLYAQSAVLMDADSGRILFGKEEKKIRPMASTTKIMTCILALEHMKEGQVVKVSDYAVCQPKVRLGVKGKEEFYIEDLLYSLMLESHNDSAVVIAEGIAGSVEEFAAMMNEKAKKLGCKDTYFITPNGLDAYDEKGTHSTTATDLARIMRYCITESPKKEAFLEITRTKQYSFTNLKGDRSFSCHNHNAFLTMMDGALSGKTGFTADAGYCYVGALRRDDRTFIVALLACGWPNNKGYKWKDTTALMEYGLDNYEYRNIWEDIGQMELLVKNGVNKASPLSKDSSVTASVDGQDEELNILLGKDEKTSVKTDISPSVDAPVKKGQKVGEVSYLLEGQKIHTYNIRTLETVEKRSFIWCLKEVLERICL